MRRILIDKTIEERVREFAELMKGNRPDLLDWGTGNAPKEKLIAFYKELVKRADYIEHARYVYTIIILYENLLVLTPDMMGYVYEAYFKKWDDILTDEVEYGSKKSFYEQVIGCMGYENIRSGLMRQYMKAQKIKVCVYCNAQPAITTEVFVENGRKKRIATYQFDHRMPESKFPFLCTSYYNLQPSCPTCNQIKRARTALFELYTRNKENLDVFRFELTPEKAVMAYVKEDMDRLEVKLHCDSDMALLENHQKLFHVDLIYAEHMDVVKRIIVILRANSGYYRQSLQEGLNSLFDDGVDDPGYFFFGYYMNKENIHLKPLSKLVQDVVEEIGGDVLR